MLMLWHTWYVTNSAVFLRLLCRACSASRVVLGGVDPPLPPPSRQGSIRPCSFLNNLVKDRCFRWEKITDLFLIFLPIFFPTIVPYRSVFLRSLFYFLFWTLPLKWAFLPIRFERFFCKTDATGTVSWILRKLFFQHHIKQLCLAGDLIETRRFVVWSSPFSGKGFPSRLVARTGPGFEVFTMEQDFANGPKICQKPAGIPIFRPVAKSWSVLKGLDPGPVRTAYCSGKPLQKGVITAKNRKSHFKSPERYSRWNCVTGTWEDFRNLQYRSHYSLREA